MDNHDYLAIETRLRAFASTLGAAEIMEDRFYLVRREADAAQLLMQPRDRVLAQLEALDRFLSLYDRGVYNLAMEKIGGLLLQVPPRPGRPVNLPDSAGVVLPRAVGEPEEIFDLGRLPVLAEARKRLRALATLLRET